jgi:hypothetical protein
LVAFCVRSMIDSRHSDLFSIWSALRGRRSMPRVSDIAAGAIGPHLRDLVVVEEQAGFTNRIRLAGTAVCDLFGEEISGRDFSAIWRDADGGDITRIASAIFAESNPVVIGALGHASDGPPLSLGCLLLPVEAEKGRPRRILGSLRLAGTARQPGFPLRKLQLASLRMLDRDRPRPGLHAAGLKRGDIALQRGHLVLIKPTNSQGLPRM